jgi:Fe-S cluster assembly scaffold protein SufB
MTISNLHNIPYWAEKSIQQLQKNKTADAPVWVCSGKNLLVYAYKNYEGIIRIGTPTKSVFVFACPDSNIEIKEERPVEKVMIVALENSRVTYSAVCRKPLSTAREAKILKNASVDWICASFGSQNQSTVSYLNGRGGKTSMTCGFYNNDSKPVVISASAVHTAPKTASRISIRGASGSNAKARVDLSTKISENAINSEGIQKANILLLSEKAGASARPKLEIENSESKAGHSVSVGQVDEKILFYLMSRGLDKKESIKTIVRGFFETGLLEMGIDITPRFKK